MSPLLLRRGAERGPAGPREAGWSGVRARFGMPDHPGCSSLRSSQPPLLKRLKRRGYPQGTFSQPISFSIPGRATMYCCNCGRQLEEEARFCSVCGTARPPVRPPTGDPYERRPLTRVRDGKIAGVCGGVARYFGLDVTLIRILWIILTIFPPLLPGVIGYIVCWIAMPQDPPPYSAPSATLGAATFSSSADTPR